MKAINGMGEEQPPRQMPPQLQHVTAIAQHAGNILSDILKAGDLKNGLKPAALVSGCFSIAEEFDRQMNEKIQAVIAKLKEEQQEGTT